MLSKGLQKISSDSIDIESVFKLISTQKVINCINPRHSSTAKALGLEVPLEAVSVSLQRGDLLIVVTAKNQPRDGRDIEVTLNDIQASWWAVHSQEEQPAQAIEIGGGDIGTPQFKYLGPLILSDSQLIEICVGVAYNMGGWVEMSSSTWLPAPLARVWLSNGNKVIYPPLPD
jgi:hypothetical protein